ncbi:hypothetical protein PT2222_20033 [Paraburkholderia tropica]
MRRLLLRRSMVGAGRPLRSDRAGVVQRANLRRVVAEFVQDGVGVLAERGHGVHARRVRERDAGRQQRGHRARGRLHLRPAFARGELCVLPHGLHVVDVCIGDLRGFEALDHVVRAEAGEGRHDERAERRAMLDAAAVRGEALVVGEFGLAQHDVAKRLPFALVLQAEHHRLAVAGLERTVRIDRGVRRAVALRRRLAVDRVVERIAHPLDHAFEHRHVDMAAAPGFAALDQRRENVRVRVHAGGDIGDRATGFRGFVGRAGNRQKARLALDQQVVGLLVAIRTVAAIARDIADDQTRITLAQRVVAEAEPLRRAGREVLHEHVGVGEQRVHDLQRFSALHVEREAFLRTVGPDEMRGETVHALVVAAREIAHAGTLDLDDARAQIRELARAERRRDCVLERDDLDAFERAHDSALRLERTRQAENMFGDVRENQVGGNRRNLIETRLAELAFDVVFAREAEAAVELQTGVGGFPRSVGGQQLRHVGLRAARLVRVEAAGGLEAHQVRGFHVDERARDRELHALVLADRTAEYLAILNVLRHLVDEPVAVADTLGRDQRALRVEAVENVLEALAFFADEIFRRNFEVVEEQLVGLVIDHVQNRLHGQALADGFAQIDDEDRHAFAFLFHVRKRRGAREQDHQVGMLHARDPHLLAVDHITVALAHGRGLDLRGVGAGGRFGHAHRLQAQFAVGDLRQILALLFFGAVAQQRAHVVHLAVARARVAAAAVDLFHDHRRFGEAESRAAVLLRNQRGEPARLRERVDEGFGIAARFVDLAVIFVRKLAAQIADGFANVLELIGRGVVHVVDLGESRWKEGACGARCFRRARRAPTWSARRRGPAPTTRWIERLRRGGRRRETGGRETSAGPLSRRIRARPRRARCAIPDRAAAWRSADRARRDRDSPRRRARTRGRSECDGR